jgi:hypothetical protein
VSYGAEVSKFYQVLSLRVGRDIILFVIGNLVPDKLVVAIPGIWIANLEGGGL